MGGDAYNSCEKFSFMRPNQWESVQLNINDFAQKEEFKSFSFVAPNIIVYSSNRSIPNIKAISEKKENKPSNAFQNQDDENENVLPLYEDDLFYIFGTDAEPFIIEYNITKSKSRIIAPQEPLKLQC